MRCRAALLLLFAIAGCGGDGAGGPDLDGTPGPDGTGGSARDEGPPADADPDDEGPPGDADPEDEGPPGDADAPHDADPDDGPRGDDAAPDDDPDQGPPAPIDVSRYLLLAADDASALRARFNARDTHPCELQVVGDSISESFLFLNPLTQDPARPDMAYADPTHCRIFGQPSIFLDLPQTAASGMTAGWGLEGDGGFGGVRQLRFPIRYTDRDGGRQPIGPRDAYPEVATILFGTNDLRIYVTSRRNWDPSPEGEAEERGRFLAALRGIARVFLDQGVVPLLITTPPGEYEAWNLELGGDERLGPRWVQGIRDLGDELGVPVFDLERLLLDQRDWPALFSDGVHPNRAGYDLINAALYDVYRDLRRHVLVR